MAYRFKIFQRPSVVGLGFVAAFMQYGVMSVSYAADPVLPLPIATEYPFFIAATFGCFVLGATLTAVALRFDVVETQQHFFEQTAGAVTGLRVPVYVALVIPTFVVGVLYATSTERTGIEMLFEFGGEHDMLSAYRVAFATENPYAYGGAMVNQLFGPVLMSIAFNMWRIERKAVWGVVALALFGMLVMTSTASLHKAPLIILIFHVFANFFFLRTRSPRIPVRAVLGTTGIVAAVGTAGYALTYGQSALDALGSTVSRVFIAPIVAIHAYLHVYPGLIDFNYGLGIGLIAKIADVKDYLNPPVLVGRLTAGPNVCFNGLWSTEMWAAFGWPGVIVGSMCVGALLVVLDRWAMARRRTATSVALFSWLVIASVGLGEGSIFTAMLSGGIGLVVPLSWLLEAGERRPRAWESSGAGGQPRQLQPP